MIDAYNLGDIVAKEGDFDAPAFIDLGEETAPRVFSRRQVEELSNAFARGLTARGLRRGDRIAILSINSVAFVATVLGAMRAGFVAVPVNYRLPAATIAHILRDCGAALLICDLTRSNDLARSEMAPAGLPRLIYGADGPDAFSSLLDAGEFVAVRPEPREPALFLYTSGSSGPPKGVVLSHQAHLWVLRARPRRPGADVQRVLMATPLYHMNGLMTSFGSVSQANSVVVLLPYFNTERFIDTIGRYQCGVLNTIPTMVAMMLQDRDKGRAVDTSSVQLVRLGSAPVTQTMVDQTRAAFPHAEVVNVYGTTEAGGVVFGAHPQGLPRPSLSVGYPHPEVKVRLVNETSTDGDDGALEMQCPAIMNGYHNMPDATKRAITADGYFITGDLFTKDANGFFFFCGRVDDMFVCGGENVSPGEVESVLERHPGIHQASVVPVADAIKGYKPVAFVVTKPGANLSEEELRAYSREHLALYQHPRRVWFLPQLPIAGTNKVDRHALTALAAGLNKTS